MDVHLLNLYRHVFERNCQCYGLVDQRENKKATRRNEKILGSNTKCQLFQLLDVFLNKCACLVLWSYVFRIGQ